MGTRNKDLHLHIPKIKLQFVKDGFSYKDVRLYSSLLKDVRESKFDLVDKVTSF